MASPFKFYRIRSGSADLEFNPGAGTRLRFANKDADSLEMPTLSQGFLIAGDKVKVTYSETTVFLGDIANRIERAGRGDDLKETVICKGPWDKMARLVYRQNWKVSNGYKKSSRIVLNQHQSGSAQNLNSELTEIATDGASACGYSLGTVSVSTKYLPFDEVRDLTIADAIRRELRFFPRTVAKFDYSQTTPALSIVRIAKNGSDAAYVASIPKSARQKRYTANPITGVDIEIETVGDGWRDISHQTAGNTSAGNPNCLYATIQLAGATSSLVTQSFKSVTEDIPSNLSDKTWWMAKHPRLKGLSANQVTISDGARSGSNQLTTYARIASATAGEIEAAGLKCRVEEFTCTAKISTADADDVESEILLSMRFLTTNATGTAANPTTYTWVVSSTATAGETCPSGLAQAILDDRSGTLLSERMTIRLGSSLPQLGDLCDDLPLQSFEVDCTALTAELEFGAPEHLSPEDMASLLSGFRNKRRPTVSTSRATGKISDLAASSESGAITPISATDWSPGRKTKTFFGGVDGSSHQIAFEAAGSAAPKIIFKKKIAAEGGGDTLQAIGRLDGQLDPATGIKSRLAIRATTDGSNFAVLYFDAGTTNRLYLSFLESSVEAAADGSTDGYHVRNLAQKGWVYTNFYKRPSFKDLKLGSGSSAVTLGKIVAEQDATIAQKTLVEGDGITLRDNGDGTITISVTGGSAASTSGYTGTRTVLADVKYDDDACTLCRRYITEVWNSGVMTSQTLGEWEVFTSAVEETV